MGVNPVTYALNQNWPQFKLKLKNEWQNHYFAHLGGGYWQISEHLGVPKRGGARVLLIRSVRSSVYVNNFTSNLYYSFSDSGV